LVVKINNGEIKIWSNSPYEMKTASATLTGTPFKEWTIDAGTNGLKKDELDDMFIILEYKV